MNNKALITLSLGFLIAIHPGHSFAQATEKSEAGIHLNISNKVPSSEPYRDPQILLQHVKGVNLYVEVEPQQYSDALKCKKQHKKCADRENDIYEHYPKDLLPERVTLPFEDEINSKMPMFVERGEDRKIPLAKVLNDLPAQGCIDAGTSGEADHCPKETASLFTNDPNNLTVHVTISVRNFGENRTGPSVDENSDQRIFLLRAHLFRPGCNTKANLFSNYSLEIVIPASWTSADISAATKILAKRTGDFLTNLSTNSGYLADLYTCQNDAKKLK